MGADVIQSLTPKDIRPPFAAYAHGVEIPAGWRILRTSGQLGIAPDDHIPADAYGQACLCFANIAAILAEGNMSAANVAHISAFVTARDHMQSYMRARDAFVEGMPHVPASTLMVVSGFTRPEFVVEVEVMAAAPP